MSHFGSGGRRSNLTKAQRRDAEAAIYGLDPHLQTPMSTSNLSIDEIERMRAILASHDANNRVGIKEFDLNNPPKLPYVHQEFPRLVYHHGRRIHRVAADAEALAEALEMGWSKEPYAAVVAAGQTEIDLAEAAEIAALDAKARRPRQK
jgi:hypothetical protein